MGITAIESAVIINHRWRGQVQPATTAYMACHTGDPGAVGAANEVPAAGYGYARQPLGLAAPIADGSAVNVAEISIGPVPQDWLSDVTYISIWDAPTGGNCLETKQIIPQVIRANGYFKISAGDYRKLFQ